MALAPLPQSIVVDTDDPDAASSVTTDGVVIRLPNGDAVVSIEDEKKPKNNDFDANLAMDMEPGQLAAVAEQLLEGIEADLQSRTEWESIRSRGIDLLGLKVEEPRSDVGNSSAPLEGMAVVRDSTLLEAVLRAQSNAIGELLPADGPVKIKDVGQQNTLGDQQADQLETDFNHYIVDTMTEYYPDTKRMLFWTVFGGSGWKKVYSCPLRRRPVSESVDAKDLIVSNAATDLWNAGRVTHRITMRPSVMKRMQFLKVYRDVALGQPTPQPSRVDQKIEGIEGVQGASQQGRPEDQPYTLYECYCELDLDEYAPQQLKGQGIPLPYRVTIDKDSREILEVHRNWKEDDEACLPRKYFVRYPYIEGMGIYGIGLVHVLGNVAATLTIAVREMLDAGMFANFPGFLYAKQTGRQLTNEFRVPPGGGVPLDAPNGDIRGVAMPLPYKDVGAGLLGLATAIKEDAQRLGGIADLPIGEGKQDAPVGTTLALIEQATKVESAVHKGMHHAQAEEFQLLKERFREDPEAFWRHDPNATSAWTKDTFLAALDNADLIPVADPNTPSHMHRIAKALAIKQLQAANPSLYDARKVDSRVLAMIRVDDADSLFAPPVTNPAPDPNQIAAQAKLLSAQAAQTKAQSAAAQAQSNIQNAQAKLADAAADRESKENIETMHLAESLVVHGGQADQASRSHALAATQAAHERMMDIHNAISPEPAAPANTTP